MKIESPQDSYKLNGKVVHVGGDWKGYGIVIGVNYHRLKTGKTEAEVTVLGKSGKRRLVAIGIVSRSRNPIQRFIFRRLWRKWYTFKPTK